MPSTIWRSDTWRYLVGPQRPPRVMLRTAAGPARQSIAPNNANVVYPVPDVWGEISSTHARCTLAGNSFLFGVTVAGTEAVDVTFDTSRMNGVTSGTTPMIAAFEDGILLDLNSDGLFRKQLVNNANSQTITIKATPSNGRHVYRVIIRSVEATSGQSLGIWGSGGSIPPGTIDVTSIGIGPTSAMAALVAAADYFENTMLVFGHSRTNGILANIVDPDTTVLTSPANNNALKSWPWIIAQTLRCEVGWIAQGGCVLDDQFGTYQGGSPVNPPMYGASGLGAGEMLSTYHWNGLPRTFSTTHKFALIMELATAITSTMVTGLTSAIRAGVGPTTMIVWVHDPTQADRAAINSALSPLPNVRTRIADPGIAIIDGSTPNQYAPDGSHLNEGGQIRWAQEVLPLIQSIIGRPLPRPTAALQAMLAR